MNCNTTHYRANSSSVPGDPTGGLVAALAALALIVAPRCARAADALPPPSAARDSSLDQFLNGLEDSTSAYFGIAATRIDTAGLDSTLTYALAHPPRPKTALGFGFVPDFAFQRADGPTYSLGIRGGDVRDLGRIGLDGGWAAGARVGLWRARYQKRWGRASRPTWFEVEDGLETWTLDRDTRTPRITTATAFTWGRDGQHYLRRRGFRVSLRRVWARFDLATAYRDMTEEPLRTTAAWDLTGRDLTTYENLPASAGRVHEVELGAGTNLPHLPVRIEVLHHTSGTAIGSDFEYRRTRVAASGNFGLSPLASLVPQLIYGRLSGQAVPQAAFYLGGTHTLRSLGNDTHAGPGLALGRLELVGTSDILHALRLPHPDYLPIQLGGFVASGAVWGVDPFGGPKRPGVDWPDQRLWRTETGAQLIYQPGFPDPTSMIRFNAAWPVGPYHGPVRFTVQYSRALEFTSTLGR